MTRALRFVVGAAGLAAGVGVVGGWLAASGAQQAVWLGAGLALAIQLVLYVTLFMVAFATRPLLAHGLGTLGRFLSLGLVALFWVPWAGVPAAPLLFSFVAVLFLTTLLEPLVLFSPSTTR